MLYQYFIRKIIEFEGLIGGFYENKLLNDTEEPKYIFLLHDYILQYKILYGYWHPTTELEYNSVIFRYEWRRAELFNSVTAFQSLVYYFEVYKNSIIIYF